MIIGSVVNYPRCARYEHGISYWESSLLVKHSRERWLGHTVMHCTVLYCNVLPAWINTFNASLVFY